MVTYKGSRNTSAALTHGLLAQLRTLHTLGADRIVTAHNVRMEWARAPDFGDRSGRGDDHTAMGEVRSGPGGNGVDESDDAGSAAEPRHSAAADEAGAQSGSKADGSFAEFLRHVEARGAAPRAMQQLSVWQVRAQAETSSRICTVHVHVRVLCQIFEYHQKTVRECMYTYDKWALNFWGP